MGVLDYLGNNAFQVDAAEEERKAREKYPLLFHQDETCVLAFTGRGGKGRDKSYFTSHRILLKNGKGIGHKRRSYLSIPYDSIVGFKVQTAGKAIDGDAELRVYTTGKSHAGIDFSAKQVDLFAVQGFLNSKIDWTTTVNHQQSAVTSSGPSTAAFGTKNPLPPASGQNDSLQSFLDWMGNDATQISNEAASQKLQVDTPVLLSDEQIDLAYQSGWSGRDLTVFTDKRVLVVDAQGIFGKKVAFISFKWEAISAFAVETAGAYFDRDTDMKLYTNVLGHDYIRQDFRKSRADLIAIQQYLCHRLLRDDNAGGGALESPVDKRQGHVDPKGNWWFRDDQRPLDATEMERYYKTEVPLLKKNETVEFAFKGRRDVTLFTNLRVIDIDPKGWKGVKIEYTSVPWTSVVAFGIKTGGKHFDHDCEVRLWTDMYYYPGGGEDDPPDPAMSFLEIDLNKRLVDVIVLKKYLSERLLNKTAAPTLSTPMGSTLASEKESGLEAFLSKIGGDGRAIDHTELNIELHTSSPILLEKEKIIMAFKAGRDVTLFTNIRMMKIDVQGLSGQKIAYDSIPYENIRAFSAESAGDWDRDSELKIYTKNRWNFGKVEFDFRKGKADIFAIQKFLSAIVMGSHQDAERFFENPYPFGTKPNPGSVKGFLAWLGDYSEAEDPNLFNTQLHSDPPILMDVERVNRAFKQGRDIFLYTTHRVLFIDVKGLSGKKVSYKSYPIKWVKGFAIETCGNLDWDAELYLYYDIPSSKETEQSILVKNFDIMEMHDYWTKYLLFPTDTAQLY